MRKRVNVYKEHADRFDFEASKLLLRVLELEGKSGDKDRMVEILTELDEAYEACKADRTAQLAAV